jgi:hypothetical protein
VTNNDMFIHGHEGEPRFCGERQPQVVDKRHDDVAVISKCKLVNLRDAGVILWALFAYQHSATVCAAQTRGDQICR